MTENIPRAKSSWLRHPLVGLTVLFLIPTALVVGGFVVVSLFGQVPGGTTTSCERTLNAEVTARIEIYAYNAGLTSYARQQFSVSGDGGQSWQTIVNDDVQVPRPLTCEANLRVLVDGALLFFSTKSVALLPDSGAEWRVQHVCDDPRPASGRCDPDPLNFVEVEFTDGQQGTLHVVESIVDEYGQPLMENGSARVAREYTLVTTDAALTWQIEGGE